MIGVFIALLALPLAARWTLHSLGRVDPRPSDLAFLAAKNLHALYVLRIVDSADYRHYASRSRGYRRYLFRSYARNLRQDVADLAGLPTDFGGLCWRGLFLLVHRLLTLKSRLAVGQHDLPALLGAELMLIRRLEPPVARR